MKMKIKINKKIKIVAIFLILILCIYSSFSKVFADPNSSKGFLNYSEEEQQEELEEEKNNQINQETPTQVLSSNNYLKFLEIEGYTLSPEFNYQILEYTINEKLEDKSLKKINIKTDASDSRAEVDFDGQIIDNTVKINVTAENGSVRTYIINFPSEEEQEENLSDEEKAMNDKIEETKNIAIDDEQNIKKDTSKSKYLKENIGYVITITIGLVILFVIFKSIFFRKKRRKSKH